MTLGGPKRLSLKRWAAKFADDGRSMRQVTYTVLPDVAGRFDERTNRLDEFVHEVEVVMHRQIPPLHIMNALLLRGSSPRVGYWEPFQITHAEYDELVAFLLSNPADRFARIEPDVPVSSPEEWWHWLESIGLG